MIQGGARTFLMIGRITQVAYQKEQETIGGLQAQQLITMGRQIFSMFKKMDYDIAMETYSMKMSLDANVPDVDFSDVIKA
jgi:hypothetical protein